MKQMFLIVGAVLWANVAMAQHIGPASTEANDLRPNVGVGYAAYKAEWDGLEVEQSRAYLHLGMGIGLPEEPHCEIYLRLGAADFETEDLAPGTNIDADFEPFGGAGIKVNFLRASLPFGLGLVAQGAYFAAWDDEIGGLDIKVDEAWEIEAAIPVEFQMYPVKVYAGPVFYKAEADVKASGFGASGSGAVEDDDNFGVFGGVALTVGPVAIEVEVQEKSDTSISGLLTYAF